MFTQTFLENLKSIEQEMANTFYFKSSTWTPVHNTLAACCLDYITWYQLFGNQLDCPL